MQQDNNCYEFGRFRLKTAERVLLREGEPVPLTPKVFDILLTLVEHGGQVVQKDDLMRRVWPNTFVEEGNLTQNISLLYQRCWLQDYMMVMIYIAIVSILLILAKKVRQSTRSAS